MRRSWRWAGPTVPCGSTAVWGEVLYAGCGVSRSEAGLLHALEEVRALREEFWADVTVVGGQARLNQELERALRVADSWSWRRS